MDMNVYIVYFIIHIRLYIKLNNLIKLFSTFSTMHLFVTHTRMYILYIIRIDFNSFDSLSQLRIHA